MIILFCLRLTFTEAKSNCNSPHLSPESIFNDDTKKGLILGFGIGMGYSSHADSYITEQFFQIKDYSGLRAIILDAKLGWGFSDQFLLTAQAKYSPANTPVSPYRSNYLGASISYFPDYYFPGYFKAGYGRLNTAVSKSIKTGSGNVFNIGAGYEISNNFSIEINTIFGKLKDGDMLDPPLDTNEFGIQFTLNVWIF